MIEVTNNYLENNEFYKINKLIFGETFQWYFNHEKEFFNQPKYYFMAILFSLTAQLGDFFISYFKSFTRYYTSIYNHNLFYISLFCKCFYKRIR